jgi:hypothetical protein
MALNEFMEWFQQAPRPGFTEAADNAAELAAGIRRVKSVKSVELAFIAPGADTAEHARHLHDQRSA